LSDPPAAAVIDGGGNTQFPGIGCAASIPVLDPQLLPPGHFGSATVVAPVAAASPVRDAADVVSCPAGDQRGRARARIVDGRPACSPGAVEFDPADVSPVTTAIEYYYAARDHYFVTPLAAEIAALDTGYFPGWARTGHTIPVLVDTGQQVLHTVPVCRFYGRPEAGLDSHFFSATPAECAQVQSRFPAAWILETTSLFTMPLPDAATGACPAGTNPVYRLFNDRADVNHRYTLYPAVRSEMLAQRWIAEGAGADGVVWCAVRG